MAEIKSNSIWENGQPLPESNWIWRRIFAYGVWIVGTIVQVVVLWYVYQMVNLAVYAVTQTTENWVSTNSEKIKASVEIVKIIIPQAMTTVFWMVILQSISTLLIQFYYMIAPSAEVIKGMTASVALAAGGNGAYGGQQTASDGRTAAQVGVAIQTPTPQKGALPGAE